ncbi:MAG: hypothetical protein ACK4XK_12295, partial [Casimicrobiaceae bacterium]
MSRSLRAARLALHPACYVMQSCPHYSRAKLVVALVSGVAALATTSAVFAEVIKCVDPITGAVEYTNRAPAKGQQCTRTDGSPLSVIGTGNRPNRPRGDVTANAPAGTGTSVASASVNRNAGSPVASVDAATQRTRDSTRRQVLADELASEEKLLADVRQQLNGGRPQPMADETVG